MDGDISLDQLAFSKFAVGQPVPRNEDPMLVSGQGRYTDDLSLPGQAYAVMNAVVDALAEYGIRHINMPATPFRVWQAIQAARNGGAR
jgi:CO/xanthine dehydrogenase Mo-binding subunit